MTALVASLVLSCEVCPGSSSTPASSTPNRTPRSSSGPAIPPPYLSNPKPFEALFRGYDHVVRASLVSIRAETEAVTTGYRPVHRLKYSVHEWLRGGGPSEIEVLLRPDHPPGYTRENRLPWCSSDSAAQAYSERLLFSRNSRNENYQVLMLLNRDSGDPSPEYRLNVRTRRVWDYHTDRETYFLATTTGLVGNETTFETKSTSPVVSLSEFRTRLRDLDNALAKSQHFEEGQSVEDYESCIHIRLNVQYFNAERVIDWSEIKDTIYRPCLPQFAPKNLMTTIEGAHITLTWDAPQTQTETIEYVMNRHDEIRNGWATVGKVITEERYTDDKVEPGRVYSYKIWAVDEWEWGPASEILTVKMPE